MDFISIYLPALIQGFVSSRGRVRRGRHVVVSKFADIVDGESDDIDAKVRERVAELISQHRILPPLVPPPKELCYCSQWLPHFSDLLFDFTLTLFPIHLLSCATATIGS